jgi:hypothetical protein
LAAILAARAGSPEDAARLLARHPAGARVEPAAASLGDVLWAELADREAAFGLRGRGGGATGRSGPAYFEARRRVWRFRRWLRAAGQLPPCWRGVLGASSAGAKAGLEKLGVIAIALAAVGRDDAELIRWLAPLGREHGTRVAVELASAARQPRSRSATESHRAAYDRAIAQGLGGAALAAHVGRAVLAGLFRTLSDAQRRSAARVGRSTIFETLAAAPAAALASASAIAATEGLVAAAFGDGAGLVVPTAAEVDVSTTAKQKRG